jgi:hypothetical protein
MAADSEGHDEAPCHTPRRKARPVAAHNLVKKSPQQRAADAARRRKQLAKDTKWWKSIEADMIGNER